LKGRLKVMAIINASMRSSDVSDEESVPWLWRWLCPKDKVKEEIESVVVGHLAEVLAPLHFAGVLLFNCFGTNHGKAHPTQ
jgi:hypothetical protein